MKKVALSNEEGRAPFGTRPLIQRQFLRRRRFFLFFQAPNSLRIS
jgi:hypothetical protein